MVMVISEMEWRSEETCRFIHRRTNNQLSIVCYTQSVYDIQRTVAIERRSLTSVLLQETDLLTEERVHSGEV